MSRPLKNREQFFKLVEEGLQQYFDTCDRYWGGILHLTVGVKCGEVGGIIKSENMLSYEGFTLHRIESILKYVLPKYIPRTEVGFAVGSILDELRVEGTPSESSQARRFCEPKGSVSATDAFIDFSPYGRRPKGSASAPSMGRTRASRKQNTKQSTLNTKQATTNTESHEQEETEQQNR